jgi:hypothetical protein
MLTDYQAIHLHPLFLQLAFILIGGVIGFAAVSARIRAKQKHYYSYQALCDKNKIINR